MELYHGTHTPFAKFNPVLAGSNTALADGIKSGLWLTDSPEYAASYGPVVLTVEVPDDLVLRRYESLNALEREVYEYDSEQEFIASILAQGYHGVIFYHNAWVAGQDIGIFDPELIGSLEFRSA